MILTTFKAIRKRNTNLSLGFSILKANLFFLFLLHIDFFFSNLCFVKFCFLLNWMQLPLYLSDARMGEIASVFTDLFLFDGNFCDE